MMIDLRCIILSRKSISLKSEESFASAKLCRASERVIKCLLRRVYEGGCMSKQLVWPFKILLECNLSDYR